MQKKVLKMKKEVNLTKRINEDLNTIIKNCSSEGLDIEA
jgi:hypothetical protein